MGTWEGIPELDRILGEIAELEFDIKNDMKILKEIHDKTDEFGETIDLSGHGGYQFINQRLNDMKEALRKRRGYVWDWFYRPAGAEAPKGAKTRGPRPPSGGGPPGPSDPGKVPPWPVIGRFADWQGPPAPPPRKRNPFRPPPEKLTDVPPQVPPPPNYKGSTTGPSKRGWLIHPRPPKPPPYIRPGMSPAGALVMPQGSKTGLSRPPSDGGPPGPTIPGAPNAPGPGGPQGSKTGSKVRQGATSGGPNLSRAVAKSFMSRTKGSGGGSKAGGGGTKSTGKGFKR